MKRILIADDHPLFRNALKDTLDMIADDFDVSEASTFDEAMALADDELDLILLDLSMPQATGFSALVALRSKIPSVPIAIVSASEDLETVRSSVQFGPAGFIPKTTDSAIMAQAIETILDGGQYWPTEEVMKPSSLDERNRRADFNDKLSKLTRSEMRVLELMSEGLANKAIAYELNIKETTVKTHVTSVLRKLDVFNRTQAVLSAKDAGFKA